LYIISIHNKPRQKYPNFKAMLYFDAPGANAGYSLGGGGTPALTKMLNTPYFIAGPAIGPLPVRGHDKGRGRQPIPLPDRGAAEEFAEATEIKEAPVRDGASDVEAEGRGGADKEVRRGRGQAGQTSEHARSR
jgi:hypothetical protein